MGTNPLSPASGTNHEIFTGRQKYSVVIVVSYEKPE